MMVRDLIETYRTWRSNPDELETADVVGLAWWLFFIPAAIQLYSLIDAVTERLTYPFDLEWMEGQMLHEALRLSQGLSIYHPPTVDFIPPLYTPLYPALLAALGSVVGIGYALGRLVNLACLVGLLVVADRLATRLEELEHPRPAAAAAMLGVAYLAAAYPWFRGWYDICRPDMLMCLLGAGGLLGLSSAALDDSGGFWRPKIAGWAAVIALSFFAKQTGLFFVAAGGAGLLLVDWRAVPMYVASAGAVGLGGVGLLVLTTDGWFWTYAYAYHQHHQTSYARFIGGLTAPFRKFPGLYAALGLGATAALVDRFSAAGDRRRADRAIFWLVATAFGILAGGVGFATQWSYFNAYIPPLLLGVLAAVAVSAPLFGQLERLPNWARIAASLVVASGLTAELLAHTWDADNYIPDASDWKHGRALVERIESVEGPVLSPMFPWYVRRAGKRPFVHQMGINDVTAAAPGDCRHESGISRTLCPELGDRACRVPDLDIALAEQRFARIFHAPTYDMTKRLDRYEYIEWIPPERLPSQPTGYQFGGVGVWRPERPADLPENGEMLFDFESSGLPDWTIDGRAWGSGPTTSRLAHQQPIGGYTGDRFMNSYHGGDGPTGTARSPLFTLDGTTLHLRVGGGNDPEKLRAELRTPHGEVLRSATGRDSEHLREVTWDVSDRSGQKVRLVLVDDSPAGWGHLLVDSVWIER